MMIFQFGGKVGIDMADRGGTAQDLEPWGLACACIVSFLKVKVSKNMQTSSSFPSLRVVQICFSWLSFFKTQAF